MKERPILFSGPMVRALLAGTKTQTRRALKHQPLDILPMEKDLAGRRWVTLETRDPKPQGRIVGCRFGEPGDRLWVRETWAGNVYDNKFIYRADTDEDLWVNPPKWRPSIHMPRALSRITLEITKVRAERLQSITNRDALAEGIIKTHGGYGLPDGSHFHCDAPSLSFLSLFESINGPGSVEADPWVWVIEFKRVKP